MKSRVSCCNGALLRRDLTRMALLWGAYLLIWLVALPVHIFSAGRWMGAVDMQQYVLGAASGTHWVSFFYGAVVAWFLFTYLNKSRSANFFGALPLRRETQFLTHYLAGLLSSLVPNFLLAGLTALAGACRGANLVMDCATWFAAQSLGYLFYYSFAVLCAMVVGQIVAMPLLYGVLNFAVVVLETVVRYLAETLMYGITFTGDYLLSWLSPFFYFVLEGNHRPEVYAIWQGEVLTGYGFTGWNGLLILAAVGVLFAAVAFFFYKYRRMEAAGDVMAVRHLKPVFRWCFIVGCTLVVGTILSTIVADQMNSSAFYPIMACLLAAAVIGCLLAEMILVKSLRVFRKDTLINCGISCVLVLVLLACCRLDAFGVVSYVPDESEIAGVRLDNARNDVENPARIREVLELHQEILDRQTETEALLRQEDYWRRSAEITYVLKNGTEVHRSYDLPVSRQNAAYGTSLIYRYEEINNSVDMILAREVPEDFDVRNIEYCQIWYEYGQEGGKRESDLIEPTAEKTVKLWQDAILADLKEGNMGTYYVTDRGQQRQFTGSVSIDISVRRTDSKHIRDYYYYTVTPEAVHTIEALKELGVPVEAFVEQTN